MDNKKYKNYIKIAFSDLPKSCFMSEKALKISGFIFYNPDLNNPFEHLKIEYFGNSQEPFRDNYIILGSNLVLQIYFSGSEQCFEFGEQCNGIWVMRPSFGPCKVVIGDKVTSNGTDCYLNANAFLEVGEDSMFSVCTIHVGDSHPVFDLRSKQRLNAVYPSVKIGPRVWVGKDASIIAPCVLDGGNIIGTKAVVKGYFPSCSLVAGVPAKIKRKNVSWIRDSIIENADKVLEILQENNLFPPKNLQSKTKKLINFFKNFNQRKSAYIKEQKTVDSQSNTSNATLFQLCGIKDAKYSGWFNYENKELFIDFQINTEDTVVNFSEKKICSDFSKKMGARVIDSTLLDNVPLKNNFANKVIVMDALENIPFPEIKLKELQKVGTKDALYIFSIPSLYLQQLQFKENGNEPIIDSKQQGQVKKFCDLLEESGFEIKSLHNYGFYWTMLFRFIKPIIATKPSDSYELVNRWAITWNLLLEKERGLSIKTYLDNLLPCTHFVIARKRFL